MGRRPAHTDGVRRGACHRHHQHRNRWRVRDLPRLAHPLGTPLTLLGESAAQVADAQRELVRIGIDQLQGSATGSPQQWTDTPLGSFERATFADLAQVRHHRPVVVLDVRRESEHQQSHIHGAVNIPVHQILSRARRGP